MAGKGIKAQMVEVESALDLARLACRTENASIYAIKDGRRYRLCLAAERAGKCVVVFFTHSDSVARYGSYSTFDTEAFRFHVSAKDLDLQSQKVHIIELSKSPFSVSTAKVDVPSIKMVDYTDLVREQAYKAVEEETTQVIYSFVHKRKRIVGSLVQVDHEAQVFVYAEMPDAKRFGFFRYGYNQDVVTAEQGVARTTDMYVPVINLKEPFKFFMPE